jgi:glycosyltransferase involved in cell wall biosynthesis
MLERMRSHPAILMVGTIEPRKGYDAAIPAFEYLWEEKGAGAPDLVIVGRSGWRTQALQDQLCNHPEFGRRLYWFKDVSDEDLCRLYEGCRGVLMASRGEGMGLPLLEAATHGCAILARDLPVFREQLLPGITFFDSDRRDVLGRAVMELAGGLEQRPEPNAGLRGWHDSVAGLLGAIGLLSPPIDQLMNEGPAGSDVQESKASLHPCQS